MKYFSHDNQYVNAECQNCGRVLKIPHEKCAPILGGLSITPAILCQCGTTSNQIGDIPSDYQTSKGESKYRASSLITQPRQLNSTVEFADFVWKPSNRVYISSSNISNVDAAIARENWWQQARSEIMNELQQYMIEGWQPITAPGADCWQCKTYKEHITKNWNAIGWIIYLIISFATLLPFLLLFFDNDYYEIVSFRVQLRRTVR